MPAAYTLPTDRIDLASGATIRTCRLCGHQGPLNLDNFYRRNDEAPFEDRCQTCRRARNREVARLRRAGTPVRAGRAIATARKFGVEIEFCGATNYELERALRARGLTANVESYGHRTPRGWKIVTDASVLGGYELVSPPLSGAEGLRQLKLATEALAEIGARVDRRCGLHVHHDVSDLSGADFARLFRGWSANQQATNGLVAPSRRNSNWAAPLTAYDLNVLTGAPADAVGVDALRNFLRVPDRYRSLNIAAYGRQGTVEVRQHQGSLSYAKIAAWIAFGQAFIAAAKTGEEIEVAADAPALVEILSRTGALPAAQAETLRRRASHFSGRPVAA